eukprot:1943361-Lingulodinium_polyedra.AAC.1
MAAQRAGVALVEAITAIQSPQPPGPELAARFCEALRVGQAVTRSAPTPVATPPAAPAPRRA